VTKRLDARIIARRPQSILVVSVAFLDVPLVTISALEDEQIGIASFGERAASAARSQDNAAF